MTFLQYISRTVYRYYIHLILNQVPSAFTRRSAIILEVDFRDPKTLTNVDLRDPKTLTEADMEVRTAV